MDIALDKRDLISFIKPAREGKIVLPQFQRDFVWAREDVKDLLVSILKGYFIGSFLLLRVDIDNIPFGMRPIAGVEKRIEELRPDLMILDGQQRLTSLFYVFASPSINLKGTKYPYKFYLDLNKLLSNDVDDAICSERADKCIKYDSRDYQFEKNIIPFTRILDWDSWATEYTSLLASKDKRDELVKFVGSIKPLWDKWIKNIRGAVIPVIEIPKVASNDEKGISEVCAIFEKMNSTGVRLTVFDLLTARLYKYREHNIDLHELWEDAISKNSLLREHSDGESDSYGVYALRFIALKRGLEVKGKTLINLKPDNFKEDWNIAIDYLEKALHRIRLANEDGFGAFNIDWMPYSTMVPVLAALLWKIDEERLDFRAYKYIQKWYWASVFLERYAGSVETTTKRDFDDIVHIFHESSFEPEIYLEADRRILNNPEFTLRDVSRINSIYKGVMNLIAIEGAKDFQADDSIEFHTLDDHHLFPQAYLTSIKVDSGENKYNKQQINCVLNRTLISNRTNRQISKLNPSEYIKRYIPSERKDSIFSSHLIDKEALDRLEHNDFDGFVKARERIVLSRLRARLLLD